MRFSTWVCDYDYAHRRSRITRCDVPSHHSRLPRRTSTLLEPGFDQLSSRRYTRPRRSRSSRLDYRYRRLRISGHTLTKPTRTRVRPDACNARSSIEHPTKRQLLYAHSSTRYYCSRPLSYHVLCK